MPRDQLVKVEKALEVVEAGRLDVVAAREKVELLKKLEAEKKKAKSAQEESLKLVDEVAHLTEEVTRLWVLEQNAKDLTEKVESFPIQITEATANSTRQAVDDFKKSIEFAGLLKEQEINSVSENVKFYRDREWLNIEKFRADCEDDMAAAKVAKELETTKVAEATWQREEETVDEGRAIDEQREGSEDTRGGSSTSVPKTSGVSGSETI